MELKFKEQLKKFGASSSKAKDSTPTQLFRKECRISGQVGGQHQRDRLSYGSLILQIEVALRKGYTEVEVIEAIIKAVNPGTPLRSYLEGDGDLTLTRLKPILKSHYQEKGAMEWFQELSELNQTKGEMSQNFVMRAKDLKQKILKSSAEATSGPQYNIQQVQSIFLNTMSTRLKKTDIQSYLTEDTPDEVLLERLTVASSLENKHQQKAGAPKKVKVQAVSQGSDVPATSDETTIQAQQIASITVGLEELKACVKALSEKTVLSGGQELEGHLNGKEDANDAGRLTREQNATTASNVETAVIMPVDARKQETGKGHFRGTGSRPDHLQKVPWYLQETQPQY